jgi:hypothetical protein
LLRFKVFFSCFSSLVLKHIYFRTFLFLERVFCFFNCIYFRNIQGIMRQIHADAVVRVLSRLLLSVSGYGYVYVNVYVLCICLRLRLRFCLCLFLCLRLHQRLWPCQMFMLIAYVCASGFCLCLYVWVCVDCLPHVWAYILCF